mgnify:FL=1
MNGGQGAAHPKENEMPEYLLSVHHVVGEEMPTDPAVLEQMFAAVGAFNDRLQQEGAWVFAGGLQPIEAATTVDNTGAEAIVTDGPFAESKEWLGGFWIIEAADLDAALTWAKAGSQACAGKVEVRPFQGEPEA